MAQHVDQIRHLSISEKFVGELGTPNKPGIDTSLKCDPSRSNSPEGTQKSQAPWPTEGSLGELLSQHPSEGHKAKQPKDDTGYGSAATGHFLSPVQVMRLCQADSGKDDS